MMTSSELIPTIEVEDLRNLMQTSDKPTIVDVREDWEYALCHVDGSIHMPLSTLASEYMNLPTDKPIVVMCHHGGRSAKAVVFLQQQEIAGAINLKGGIHAWAQRIDPSMKTYD